MKTSNFLGLLLNQQEAESPERPRRVRMTAPAMNQAVLESQFSLRNVSRVWFWQVSLS